MERLPYAQGTRRVWYKRQEESGSAHSCREAACLGDETGKHGLDTHAAGLQGFCCSQFSCVSK
jgi:hypothetical protein